MILAVLPQDMVGAKYVDYLDCPINRAARRVLKPIYTCRVGPYDVDIYEDGQFVESLPITDEHGSCKFVQPHINAGTGFEVTIDGLEDYC